MSKTHTPEELLAHAKASVEVALMAPLTFGLEDQSASADVTLAAYFIMCAEVVFARLAPRERMAARMQAADAGLFADEQLKNEAKAATAPEFVARG